MFDFVYFCVDRGITIFENGEAKTNWNASGQPWYNIHYCEFLKVQLQNRYLFDTWQPFKELYEQYIIGVQNHNIMNNLKSNPKELREFQQKAFKDALKKPD